MGSGSDLLSLPLLHANRVPGVAVGALRDGAWTLQALGARDVERALPVAIETPFEVGSLSKPLFACAFLQLVAEGSLDLDAPVDDYLPHPFLPNDPAARAITARHLLSHSSGLPNWRPRRFTDRPGPLEIRGRPGEAWRYSGEGFQLLQEVVENVSGERLEVFMRRRLLDPLELRASSYTSLPAYEDRVARGYTVDGTAVPIMDPRLLEGMAAASLKSTVPDLARLVDALLGDDAGDRLGLPGSPRELLFEPQIEVAPGVGGGLGWGVEVREVGNVGWHWCSNRASFWAFLAVCAQTGEAAIALTNSPGGSAVCESVVRRSIVGSHPAYDAPPLGPGDPPRGTPAVGSSRGGT
jgi:CubicO group peptidase (beta-lactamase class C family)